jgi:hypothetical protein
MKKKTEIEIEQMLGAIDNLLDSVPQLVHAWRFAAAIVLCLREYYAFPVTRKRPSESDYIPQTKRLIEQLKKGTKIDDKFLRGFYYNSTLMRLDALFERLFKTLTVTTGKVDGPCVYELFRAQFPSLLKTPYQASIFHSVRKEVNKLKHETGGAHPKIREKRHLPKMAFRELLEIFRNPDVITLIRRRYPIGTVVVGFE